MACQHHQLCQQNRVRSQPFASMPSAVTNWRRTCILIILIAVSNHLSHFTFSSASMKVTASFIQSTQLQQKRQFDRMVVPGVVVASDIKVTVKTSNRNSCLNVFKSRYADSSFATMANSTILTPAAAAARVGIQPTIEAAPAFVWKWLWKGHQMLLPLLHITDDSNQPPVRNNDLSLWVLWNKAIAAQDKKSPVYDNDWTYDMLPSITRYFIKIIPNQLFPRLYHANIEIRTAYLNQVILQEMIRNVNENKKVRIVSIGAGYDVRCSRLLSVKHPNDSSKNLLTEAWELDVPDVIQPKVSMLHRLQYRRRQQKRQDRDDEPIRIPHVRPLDLNNSTSFENVLNEIIRNDDDGDETWHTIFVSEAVFIYLDKGIPRKVMQQCRDAIIQSGTSNTASFCFADRLENSPGGDEVPARMELQKAGWNLFDWFPRPGLARHMGLAYLLDEQQ